MSTSIIHGWIEVARWAPSGGNAQPWHIVIRSGHKPQVSVSIDRKYAAHPSLMDLDGSASVLSLGAFVETLCQVAELDGYTPEKIRLSGGDHLFRSSIEVEFAATKMAVSEEVARQKIQSIKTRHTNRNEYHTKAIPESFLEMIKAQSVASQITPTLIDKKRPELIKILTHFEKVRWEDPHLVHSLLEEITLKNESSSAGIPVTHLGVGLDGQTLLALFKTHPKFRKLLSFGLSGAIAQGSIKKPIKQAGHFVYLSADQNNFESYFKLGRLVQKIWLAAHEAGLAFQPFCGHLLAYHSLHKNNAFSLSSKHEAYLLRAKEEITHSFKIDLAKPLFGFRLGYAVKSGEVSPRKPTAEFVIEDNHSSSIAI